MPPLWTTAWGTVGFRRKSLAEQDLLLQGKPMDSGRGRAELEEGGQGNFRVKRGKIQE
jgi:hypothetical protein